MSHGTGLLVEDAALGRAYDHRLMVRLWRYTRGSRGALALSALLFPLLAGLDLIQPYLVKVAIDEHILPGDLRGLTAVAAWYLLTLAAQSGLRYAQAYLVSRAGQRVVHDLRAALFGHVQRLSARFFDRTPVGRLMTRILGDVEAIGELFASGVVAILGDVVTLAGVVAVMLLLDWRLALVTFAAVPVLFGVAAFFRARAREAYREVRNRLARLNACLQETLAGMTVLQLFGREAAQAAEFARLNEAHRRALFRRMGYDAFLYAGVELVGSGAVAALIFWGGAGILAGTLTFGALVAFMEYTHRFFLPIRDLSAKYTVMQSAVVAAERIFGLLDTPPELVSPPEGYRPGGTPRGARSEDGGWQDAAPRAALAAAGGEGPESRTDQDGRQVVHQAVADEDGGEGPESCADQDAAPDGGHLPAHADPGEGRHGHEVRAPGAVGPEVGRGAPWAGEARAAGRLDGAGGGAGAGVGSRGSRLDAPAAGRGAGTARRDGGEDPGVRAGGPRAARVGGDAAGIPGGQTADAAEPWGGTGARRDHGGPGSPAAAGIRGAEGRPPDPGGLAAGRAVSVPRGRPAVELEEVWFTYAPETTRGEPEDPGWVLRGLSVRVEVGERLAVVGLTGAGKTTLARLLIRAYDVQRGAVRVDGVDVRAWDLTALRRHVGLVLQDVVIFSGTVEDNLRLGRPEAPRAAVEAAVRQAHLEALLRTLPRGLAEELRERGANLSQGQRQLVALARALVYNPPVLVLDEATSSVDPETEGWIQDALDRLLAGRTSVVIAHRFSTIRRADRVLVLHRGRILEEGPHDVLLRRGGVYAALHELQFGAEGAPARSP